MAEHSLHARLRYLRDAEAVLALALPGALAWYWLRSGATVDWSLRLPPAVLIGGLLLQGAGYWHLKLEAMRSRRPLPGWFRPLYLYLRTANLVALAAVALWLGWNALRGAAGTDLAWAAAMLAFAVLEYVNYYAVQLMHSTRADLDHLWRHRRLRRAALATDLARRRGTD